MKSKASIPARALSLLALAVGAVPEALLGVAHAGRCPWDAKRAFLTEDARMTIPQTRPASRIHSHFAANLLARPTG